jgi:hypothetical protein
MVWYFGNYDAPFIPMVAFLCVGAFLWLKVDPEHQLFEEDALIRAAPAEVAV